MFDRFKALDLRTLNNQCSFSRSALSCSPAGTRTILVADGLKLMPVFSLQLHLNYSPTRKQTDANGTFV